MQGDAEQRKEASKATFDAKAQARRDLGWRRSVGFRGAGLQACGRRRLAAAGERRQVQLLVQLLSHQPLAAPLSLLSAGI